MHITLRVNCVLPFLVRNGQQMPSVYESAIECGITDLYFTSEYQSDQQNSQETSSEGTVKVEKCPFDECAQANFEIYHICLQITLEFKSGTLRAFFFSSCSSVRTPNSFLFTLRYRSCWPHLALSSCTQGSFKQSASQSAALKRLSCSLFTEEPEVSEI